MSLYGALQTGVSGLAANSRALAITSSNIANVNTVGYKASGAEFSTFLAASSNPGDISPSSVQVSAAQRLSQQGLLQSTGSSTDLAISGNGFFIVTDNPNAASPSTYYTRAGAFATDQDGYLRNAAGYYLEGWALNPDGSMPANRSALSAINLGALSGTAEPTSTVTLKANLKASEAITTPYTAGDMADGTVTPDFAQTFNIYDTQGGSRPMQLAFVKTAADTWAYEISYVGNPADIGGAANNPLASGTAVFNADGTLASPPGVTLTIPWVPSVTGLGTQAVQIGFGTVGQSNGLTQYDSPSALTSANVDGAPYGAVTSVSVDDQGYVTALFDNGIQQKVFKLPIATFANPNGLAMRAGNAYQRTDEAGLATVLEAKTGGAGSIAASSLESSTVDLAKEFSDLITTQRAYSAATRIITTADDMLQELMQIKR